MSMACPHCGASTVGGAAFCGQCGKAVPAGGSALPRIVDKSSIAATGLGRTVQSAELAKEARKAFTCLLAVAILQTLATGLIGALAFGGAFDDPAVEMGMKVATAIVGAIALVLYGLAFWARKNPLPAAITGLVLLVSLWLIDILLDPTSAARGIVIKIIVIAVLVKAIQAGLAYRRLQAAAGGAAA